jgi:hypothetical protein
MNRFVYASSAWIGWVTPGGGLSASTGMTTVFAADGVLWFAGADSLQRFWINSWNGDAFGEWTVLANGTFASSSIPQIAAPNDGQGSIYVIGTDTGGRVWSDSYVPSSNTLTGWVDRGASAVFGQPSVVSGTDGFVYVGVRNAPSGSPAFIGKIPSANSGSTINWVSGGWVVSDPVLAALPATIWLSALASGGDTYIVPFYPATMTFGTWEFTSKMLADQTVAQDSGGVYFAGRDSSRSIWWYDMATQAWASAGASASAAMGGAQQGSASPAYPALSVNGGTNIGQVFATVAVPLSFTIYDSGGVASDIGYAQFALVDSSNTFLCYGDWGPTTPPNTQPVLALYALPPPVNLPLLTEGTAYGYGVDLADAFCTISLKSVSDTTGTPPSVTAVVNFTLNPGDGGPYTVETQVNVLGCGSTCAGPWEAVGTLTVGQWQSGAAPTVTLTDNTTTNGTYYAFDYFTLTVTGQANAQVSVIMNGVDYGVQGTTNNSGVYVLSGQWTSAQVGSYTQVWYVAGIPSAGISFAIVAATPTVTLTNLTFPPSSNFQPGNQYSFTVAGPVNAAVVLKSQKTLYSNLSVVSNTVTLGMTDSNGRATFPGTWGTGDLGLWQDTFTVGGSSANALGVNQPLQKLINGQWVAVPNTMAFTVNAVSCPLP